MRAQYRCNRGRSWLTVSRNARYRAPNFPVSSIHYRWPFSLRLWTNQSAPAGLLFGLPFLGGFLRVVYYVDPLRIRRGRGVVVIVPVPPLVRRSLGVALRRVLPSLLTSERRDIEVAPGGPHRLVAAAVDEVCAEHPLAVAEEHVVAVPFVDAEVRVEAVGDCVPGHLPAHPRLQARDVRLRRA